jgi:hypothetical protein
VISYPSGLPQTLKLSDNEFRPGIAVPGRGPSCMSWGVCLPAKRPGSPAWSGWPSSMSSAESAFPPSISREEEAEAEVQAARDLAR